MSVNARQKSPIAAESKVARYIKYGHVDLMREEAPKLTAQVYLQNLKNTQEKAEK